MKYFSTRKILVLSMLGLAIFSNFVSCQQDLDLGDEKQGTVDLGLDADEDDKEEAYKVRVLRFGETNEENEELFGIYTNPFHLNLTEQLLELNNHISLLYVADSAVLT